MEREEFDKRVKEVKENLRAIMEVQEADQRMQGIGKNSSSFLSLLICFFRKTNGKSRCRRCCRCCWRQCGAAPAWQSRSRAPRLFQQIKVKLFFGVFVYNCLLPSQMMIESGSLGPYSGADGENEDGAESIGSALPYRHRVEMISSDL